MEDGSVRGTVDPQVCAEMLFSLVESHAFNILLELEKDSASARRRFRAAVAVLSA